jgi:bifunctional oligoribonuclease and PAP phosphatase NrnA
VYDTSPAARFIGEHSRFIVVGHKEPDGDCVASEIAVGELLSALGKTAALYSAGPFDRPEIVSYAGRFSSSIAHEKSDDTAVIIVDCSTPDRTGALSAALEGYPTLVIDHHSAGETFGEARYVNSSAPSTTMLVFQLFEDMGLTPSTETAKLLLFGLCTDTGFFRHLGQNGVETFAAVSRLTRLGTSTSEVYMMVYGMRELASRKLLAEMISRVESRWGDRLLLTWQTIADRERLGVTQRGEDDLYRLLQTIKGNVVVALIKEERPGTFSVGLRSNTTVDVGAVAASFGGGGHKQASGFDIAGTLDSVRQALVDTFTPILSGK